LALSQVNQTRIIGDESQVPLMVPASTHSLVLFYLVSSFSLEFWILFYFFEGLGLGVGILAMCAIFLVPAFR